MLLEYHVWSTGKEIEPVVDRCRYDILGSEIDNADPGEKLLLQYAVPQLTTDDLNLGNLAVGFDYDMEDILAPEFRVTAQGPVVEGVNRSLVLFEDTSY